MAPKTTSAPLPRHAGLGSTLCALALFAGAVFLLAFAPGWADEAAGMGLLSTSQRGRP